HLAHPRPPPPLTPDRAKATLTLSEATALNSPHVVGSRPLTPAPPGSTDPATATGDYVLDPETRVITRTHKGALKDDSSLTVSLVAPGIHRESAPETRIIPSSAPPAPPVVRQVVPLFHWDRPESGQSRRRGNAVRVYLDRPWWNSGPGELLGVVVAPGTDEPSAALRQYLTAVGSDPSVVTPAVTPWLRLNCFPRSTASASSVELAEYEDDVVAVAGHPVAFDSARDLWYCDIEVRTVDGAPFASWFPFLRLALVRYQPHSLDKCSVSTVVQAPMAQLTPERTAGISTRGNVTAVTVTGPAYTRTSRGNSRPTIQASVEQANPSISDPHLRWEDISTSVVTLNATGTGANTTWAGNVPIPAQPFGNAPLRLRLMETETHLDGRERLVYLDFLPIRN
ncbi:hypothetical protein ACFWI9_14915, partial [Streptomyces sp. NPDC127084]